MSDLHYFPRYSSKENTVTNNTLQLISRIYEHSVDRASEFLGNLVDTDIPLGCEFQQQTRTSESVPDGSIIQRSFKILIESKLGSGVSTEQLMGHAEAFDDEEVKVLLFLSKEKPNEKRIESIKEDLKKTSPDILFSCNTYDEICDILEDFFSPHETTMRRIADDYISYCSDIDLTNESKYLMRVVPCSVSYDLNGKYGIYYHPSDRGYRKHSYIGIYTQKCIHYIWEIDSVFDVTYDGNELKKVFIDGRDTDDYDQKLIGIIEQAEEDLGHDLYRSHRFFCGKKVHNTNFRKVSKYGIQGARYMNLNDVLDEYGDTSQIAEKLKSETWE
ncbi:hypothetical protein [Rhodohalobacter sulfatireducens]|uniref:Uncharacterized protein n=1 Tax=Rhodohalobacter sulfatireducens TaxID=2911366 RepID=A0ABS9KA96_9BACT|nr:hypothetical protein [Rhodohalobacter sulfatireducens]MCG2587776.1 hypothetical protein [Rhodohalobacter sulfatireducens]